MSDVAERAKAALEGIRPAPWQVVGYGNMHAGEPGEHPPLGKIYGTANAEFVAAARSLVPELIKEVERLRYQIEHSGDHMCDECWPNG